MNKENLHNIFSNYINKFEIINNSENYEIYKWEVAYNFSSLMNPDSQNFISNFHDAVKMSSNLIDSANRYPFSSLYTCAQKDEEAVRNLFKNLFAEDNGDLGVRQKKIETSYPIISEVSVTLSEASKYSTFCVIAQGEAFLLRNIRHAETKKFALYSFSKTTWNSSMNNLLPYP